jgi:hypothetical protein
MMRKIILIIALIGNIIANAQDIEKTVTITVTGTGKTIEEAKTTALRSAIEQAFGVFISSKTEILNDNLISDEILSVSNGNIQKYDIISQEEIPSLGFSVLIRAIVSITRLTSFAQSKGMIVELKGGVYAANIKQQLLNENSEVNAISQIFGVVHELLQNSFDFNINVQEPQSLSSDSQKWKIPIIAESKSNKNIEIVNRLIEDALTNLSLSEIETENYKTLGKKVYTIRLKLNDTIKVFYLRRSQSFEIIKNIESNWFFYATNFIINNNYESIFLTNRFSYYYDGYRYYKYQYGCKENSTTNNVKNLTEDDKSLPYPKIFPIVFNLDNEYGLDYFDYNFNLNLMNIDIKAIELKLDDYKTLQQLENLEAYKIINAGLTSQYKYGGYILEETSDKFLIVAPFNIINDNRNIKNDIGTSTSDKNSNWFGGMLNCKELNLSNNNDWFAPNRNELLSIINKLFIKGIGTLLGNDGYWINEEKDSLNSYLIPFDKQEVLITKSRHNYINSKYFTNKNNFNYFGLSLKCRPIRYQLKGGSGHNVNVTQNNELNIQKNNEDNLKGEKIEYLFYKNYEEGDLVHYIFEDANGKSFDFSSLPKTYKLIDDNYNINPQYLNKKFKIKWKAVPDSGGEDSYPYNEIITIELIE